MSWPKFSRRFALPEVCSLCGEDSSQAPPPRIAGPSLPKRFLTLDALRGIAALAVVVWHWQHFFYSPSSGLINLPDRSIQPLYSALRPLYLHGDQAVDLFFSLSGFVFFFLYADPIERGTIGVREFAVRRLARLYPLHAVTLFSVAALQALYRGHCGRYFIYQENDLPRFFSQLFFASNWLPGAGFSFNGPAWSVSVEVVLYCLFFLACRLSLRGPVPTFLIAAIGASLAVGDYQVGRGVLSFFIGGICFYVFAWASRRPDRAQMALKGALAATIMCILVARSGLFAPSGLIAATVMDHYGTGSAASAEALANIGYLLFLRCLAFPALIIFLALAERDFSWLAARFAWLGDVTYSIYLIHFPLQLAIVTAAEFADLRIDFRSAWTLASYLACLLFLSLVSHRFVELPAQRRLLEI